MPTKPEVRNARSPSTDNRHQRYLSAASRELPRENVKRHSNSRRRGSADDPGTSAHGHQHSGHCDGFDLSPKECQTWSLLLSPNWRHSKFLVETLAQYLASLLVPLSLFMNDPDLKWLPANFGKSCTHSMLRLARRLWISHSWKVALAPLQEWPTQQWKVQYGMASHSQHSQ